MTIEKFLKKAAKVYPPLRRILSAIRQLFLRIRGAPSLSSINNYQTSVVGGTIEVSPRNIPGRFRIQATSDMAMYVVLYGVYEPEMTKALLRITMNPGVFVNIGANVGFYSIFAAKVLGFTDVIAVEPNPAAFDLLLENISANGLDKIVAAHCKCIAHHRGDVKFASIDGKPEYSSVGTIVHPGISQTDIRVQIIAAVPLVDVVGVRHVSLIFVDTEGSEAEVFSGAEEILKRDKPILFFECVDFMLRKFGNSSQGLEDRLHSMGYVVRDAFNPSRKLVHPFSGEAVAHHESKFLG